MVRVYAQIQLNEIQLFKFSRVMKIDRIETNINEILQQCRLTFTIHKYAYECTVFREEMCHSTFIFSILKRS